MKDFAGRVAVVTGGASGIGRAMADRFAAEGMKIVLADIEQAALDRAETEIRTSGATVTSKRTDVSRAEDVEALAKFAVDTFGAVHILCNNAGVGMGGTSWQMTVKDWQWVVGVNLWGVIHGLLAFLPRMIAQKQGGHIVNTASMAGLIATQGLGVYNTTKYAVVGLSETLVKDLKPYGIGVSVLCPMGVETRILDSERNRPSALRDPDAKKSEPVPLMGRTLKPEEVATQVLAAIRANQLYVITHAEGLEPLRRRFERMEEAIPGS